jgi:excinuclease ABC subunit A
LVEEISSRLGFLNNVGLNYLSLDRSAETLSGGENQRIRLASQIGAGLVGVTYILDEPSIGLHQKDNDKLIETLYSLRDLGNTVIVVEHDECTIRAADYVIDIGPGAGSYGGEIIAEGTPESIENNENSITGMYISGKKEIKIPKNRVLPGNKKISILGASSNNLKNLNVDIPIGLMTCVTGVSGSGKSTLINETLYKYLSNKINKNSNSYGKVKDIKGWEEFDKIIEINQSPIGRTPRSNPATYTGLFTIIRDLFSSTQESRSRGYNPGRFSFNVKGGRCESCHGDGVIKVEMHFLPDIYVQCDICKGKRYNNSTLEVLYKNKNISEVLDMTVDEAYSFFDSVPTVKRKLKTLVDVGLSYITVGQNATTLSGGEAQRVKLAKELSKRDTGKTIYIFDEPTTGLHFHDINQLLKIIYALRDKGNTIIIIEHNLDVIKTADWIIDMGPEGGIKGGTILEVGTPEKISKNKKSFTGTYLKKIL